MAEFYAKWAEMKDVADRIGSYSSLLKSYGDEVSGILGKLPLSGNVSTTICSNLNKEINNISDLSDKITSMSSSLESIANKYQSTENELLGVKNEDSIYMINAITMLPKSLDYESLFCFPLKFNSVEEKEFGIGDIAKGTEVAGFFASIYTAAKNWDTGATTAVDAAFSLVTNIFDNIEEYQGGDMSVERAISETVTETIVDVGLSVAVGALVSTIGAPAVVATLASAGIVFGANFACKKLTKMFMNNEKDLGELTADGLYDAGEYISEKIKDLGSGVVKNVSEMGSLLERGFKSLFSF